MGWENILKFDLIPLFAGWGLLNYYVQTQIEEPISLQKIQDLDKREVEKQTYLNNYVSLIHAFIIMALCKYPAFYI